MRFTRLKLNGFKSFVDPTDLVIADGLTGVVGPNGCGKSNLLEALRWVMGENRPTAMRGAGMEDVIFGGASRRPARHFAEVALSLDNSDRRAPAGFNETDTLDIVRRITRDAGSAFRVNGKEVRARDVQMLFADAATGAHSPALVRQGQISDLINAKPRARRRVLEDAAGIGGLYQRRHEAELRLQATEANLARVDDVLEALAGQLAGLARQAKQAARYREIGAALRRTEAAWLLRLWQEADAAHAGADDALRAALGATASAETEARRTTAAREAAEEALPPAREEAAVAGAIVQRLDVEAAGLDDERKRAEGTVATLRDRLAQIDRDMEREATLNADAADALSTLSAEADTLREALDGHDARLDEADRAATAAAARLAEAEAALAEGTEAAARLTARHQAAERAQAEARAAHDGSRAEAGRAGDAAAEAVAALQQAGADLEAAEAELAGARDRAAEADRALTDAETARAASQTVEGEARAALAAAEGEARALRTEVAALASLAEREAGTRDQILDRITVAPGFERALGAALADDLHAPLLGPEATGADTGWAALSPADGAIPLPEGAAPLANRVTAPDTLTRRLAQIGLVDAGDGARLQPRLAPGQRLVSRAGDLWRWDGFRRGADDASGSAAIRLEQRNRLSALRIDLAARETEANAAAEAHAARQSGLDAATDAERAARAQRREADAGLTAAQRAHARAEGDRALAEGRHQTALRDAERHRAATGAAEAQLAEAEAAQAALPDLDACKTELTAARATVEAARAETISARGAHDELRRAGEARRARQQTVAREIARWRERLGNAEARAAELSARRDKAAAALTRAQAAPDEIAAQRAKIDAGREDADARRRRADDALHAAETALREATAAERSAERAASEAREARARAEAQAESTAGARDQAVERIREATDSDPAALAADLDAAEIPDAAAAEAEVARLRRARDALGAVNLRAEEDARTVEAEHAELAAEKADLDSAVARLRSGIAGLNREGRERLLAAFDRVNANFGRLFAHLFGGGEARLTLVESDDPLEAGLEILCQPPGKKLSVLSLLSGGEQTLTALALIFAVFQANPAPICVLDEVDAPLDDANVTRFCDLLDAMSAETETRFLIITHHAVTMARMDRLFGVTMAEHGVSQLVSVDLKRAEAMVA